MSDAIIWAAAATAITAMICLAALRGWRGWLDYRRLELASRVREEDQEVFDGSPALRIELSDVKERLRKLEAIARGVDL